MGYSDFFFFEQVKKADRKARSAFFRCFQDKGYASGLYFASSEKARIG